MLWYYIMHYVTILCLMLRYYALRYDIMYYATLLYITYIIHNMTYKIYLITLGHQYRRNKNIDDALEKY